MTVRQRAWGPDRLHKAPLEELPPEAREWRRLCHRLWALRSWMKRDPLNPKWKAWRKEGLEILNQQKKLVPVMRKLGFRVYSRRGTIPEESLHAKRLRESIESQERGLVFCDPTRPIEGWEIYSEGLEEAMASVPPIARPDR